MTEKINNPHEIKMYSFYDKKSKKFDTPFFCQSDLFAGRHYKMVTEKQGSLMATFQEDFDVYRLGLIDLETGKYTLDYECIITGKAKE